MEETKQETESGPPRLLDDWRLMWWLLVNLLGVGVLSWSSSDRVDLAGVVGIGLLVFGVAGAYRLGLRRTSSGTQDGRRG